jgi:hypothetical protein
MALALIHHIAISNNLPLDETAKFFAGLSRYLIIEFVPKQDSQVDRLLATHEDIFPRYTTDGFEQAFKNFFDIQIKKQIVGTERTMYLLKSQLVSDAETTHHSVG